MNGKSHSIISAVAVIPTSVTIGFITGDPLYSAAAAIGCLSGILLTPDLDLDSGFMPWAVNRARNLSWTFYIVYMLIWWPYRKLVPHRHWISHGYFVSTIIRVLYIAWPAILIWGLDLLASPHFIYFFIGLFISDALHILVDSIPRIDSIDVIRKAKAQN